MTRYAAFLRGINLGRRRLKMDELRGHIEALGFSGVSTFIASGNVLFTARSGGALSLERRIEGHLQDRLGYGVDTFVRTAGDVLAIARSQPFPAADLDAAQSVQVTFLKDPLPPSVARRLERCRTDVDSFRVYGREIYWLCRVRTSASTIWTSPAVKALALPAGTMRTMNTVRSIAGVFESGEARPGG